MSQQHSPAPPSRAAAPAARSVPASGTTFLVSPARPEAAVKAWRKLITGVEASGRGGAFDLEGKFLEPGIAYEVTTGAVVVVVDRYGDRTEVVMARVSGAGLETVKEWSLRAPLGKRVTDFVGRRLSAGSPGHRAVRKDTLPNDYAGRCVLCRNAVAARAGRMTDAPGYERKRPAHLEGQCPPPPPPPEVIVPNRRSEPCQLCGSWVEPGEGVARLLSVPCPVTGALYRAEHTGCPADGLPGPVNRRTGWCGLCGQPVKAGAGYWDIHAREVRHGRGGCPAPEPEQVWWARRPRGEAWLKTGQVRRVQVDLRGEHFWRNRAVPVNGEVPAGVPGFRVLSPTYVELVGRVLECTEDRQGRQWARVRAATGAEAVELLAAEGAREAEAEPVGSLLRAPFSAEVIVGVLPWLAEITGRSRVYGWEREFLDASVDYTHSNRRGTRGAVYHWSLKPNRVYETEYALSRRVQVREYLTVGAGGDVRKISEEEVVAWLNAGATWPAH
ncbi:MULTISPECIES: hypothetical protein [unclassified Streptomyces]|uniref:hypothetical protein n=1 Tax=unclassified Streptomyces TaxID=2593676 RepID=UPI003450AD32